MARYFLSRSEQETTISFNVAEDSADLYTADPVWIRKMDKLVKANPEQFRLSRVEKYQGGIVAKSYLFPKRFLTIRSKDIKCALTDEQKAERAKRLRRGHLNQFYGEISQKS